MSSGMAPSPRSVFIHNLERTIRPLELRAEGRRLEGTILKYGEISPNHQERFLPGAFSLDPGTTRWLDYRHDRTRVLAHTSGGGLTLRDSPEALLLEAELPSLPLSTRALDEIASGALQGLSIEFRAESESREGNIRVVEKADLAGIGLVASPSYPNSRVETRAAGTLSTSIPWNHSLACECYGRGQSGETGKGMTSTIEFEEGSFELPDDLVAIWKNFAAPLASTRKGTLRIGQGRGGLSIELDIPSTSWGEDIVAASAGVEIYARPVFDAAEIEATEIVRNGETIARLNRVPVRAILVGPTPNSRGWPEVDIIPSEDRKIPFSRRDRYAWL